jgi:hypothetical protein
MMTYDTSEIDRAFQEMWATGQASEDWSAWADFFTEDVDYHERNLGSLKGREAVREWIELMPRDHREFYTIYQWHEIFPDGRVIVYMLNRRDHPSGHGTIDFPGISILQYAGDRLFSMQEDFWSSLGGEKTLAEYEAACAEHDPKHKERGSRLNWGDGPAWTRGAPSYAESVGGRKRGCTA